MYFDTYCCFDIDMSSAWDTPHPKIAKSVSNGVALSTCLVVTHTGIGSRVYRGTSLPRENLLLGPYS